jgi:SAM-dependent methyltransferase
MAHDSISVSEFVSKCAVTGRPVTKILDFGQHPYADTFIAENQKNLSEPVFPLEVYLNAESGSIQLGYMSNAEERYNLYSYSYTSSNSKTARDHWDEYAATIQDRYPRSGLVVEIGSNDGYLIKQFQTAFVKTLGVDSSETMCRIAQEQGVECVNGLFNRIVSAAVRKNNGPASIIMANNVFNHANDPVHFARAVHDLLTDDGVFVFEVPYWAKMVKSGRFTDMVYHEHPTYFTIKMVKSIFDQAGLVILDYDIVDYHGGSLRVVAGLERTNTESAKVADAIEYETKIGLFDPEMYSALQSRFEQQRTAWLADFYHLKHNNPDIVIIGVGAAAKANTWLRWHGLDANSIDYVTDSSPHKQGKYTPLSRIPIVGDEIFANYENPYALILSWNISEGLKRALLNINPNIKFISQ